MKDGLIPLLNLYVSFIHRKNSKTQGRGGETNMIRCKIIVEKVMLPTASVELFGERKEINLFGI